MSYGVHIIPDFNPESVPDLPGVPKFATVCLGGSFDRIHRGHLLLLATAVACVQRGGSILVGVVDGPMLTRKPYGSMTRCYDYRKNDVLRILNGFIGLREDLLDKVDTAGSGSSKATETRVEKDSVQFTSSTGKISTSRLSESAQVKGMQLKSKFGDCVDHESDSINSSRGSYATTVRTSESVEPVQDHTPATPRVYALPYAAAYSSTLTRTIPDGHKSSVNVQFFQIHDPYGPSITSMLDNGILVVSTETILGGHMINIERLSRGLTTVALAVVPLLRDRDGEKVSSTRIREEESVSDSFTERGT